MSYRSQFIDSLRFLGQIEPESFMPEDQLRGIEEVIVMTQTDPDVVEAYDQGLKLLAALGEQWIKSMPYGPQHKCHSLAQGFMSTWSSTPFAEAAPLAMTIGNVYYKGQNIYETTRDSIVEAIRIGPTTEKLPMHVWLTRDDMTVIDFAIQPSLTAMGLMEPVAAGEPPLLVWKETDPGDFHYEPLLVHNNFFHLVDEGEGFLVAV